MGTRPSSSRPPRQKKWTTVLLMVVLVAAVTVVQLSFLSNVSNAASSTMVDKEQQLQTEQLYLAKVDELSDQKTAQHTVLNRNISSLVQTLLEKERVLSEKEKALTEKEKALEEQEKAHESQLVAAHRAQIALKRQARGNTQGASSAETEGRGSTIDTTKASKFRSKKQTSTAPKKVVTVSQAAKSASNIVKPSTSDAPIIHQVSGSIGATVKPSKSTLERRHSCLNKDFTNTHDRAVFSLLIPKEDRYITAAQVMGASVDMHTNDTDKVILELSSNPLTRYQWAQLQRAGWTHKCTISPIKPSRRPSPRLLDQFSKLHVWGMSLYDVAVYMDADTVAIRDLNELMNMQLESQYKIGVTADYRMDYGTSGAWTSTFNTGMFMIHPDWAEYRRLVQLQEDRAIQDYEYIMAEQGWLNAVYNDSWKDVGLIYNANVAGRNDPLFKDKANDLRIIHYTTMKPWFGKPGSQDYDLLCKPWLDIRDRIFAQLGCINDDYIPPTDKKFAIVTLVTDMGESDGKQQQMADYTYGAATLLKSIQEHVESGKVDHILLEIPTRRLPDVDRAYLKGLGWNICAVTPIDAKYKPFGRFINHFNKFHFWSFVEYDKIIYLDSDTLVTGNIDKLLATNLTEGKMIGVTRDYFGIKFVKTFNMGAFIIKPNMTEFHRLMRLQANDEVSYTHHQAEQGFLNSVYYEQWQEIGIEHNANFAVYASKPSAWPADPKILHFTLEKPWQKAPPKSRAVANHSRLDEFLQIWVKAATKYGVWPPQAANTTRNEPS
jgi:lipopolysaccharide biosynthesis glycosyltransferase